MPKSSGPLFGPSLPLPGTNIDDTFLTSVYVRICIRNISDLHDSAAVALGCFLFYEWMLGP